MIAEDTEERPMALTYTMIVYSVRCVTKPPGGDQTEARAGPISMWFRARRSQREPVRANASQVTGTQRVRAHSIQLLIPSPSPAYVDALPCVGEERT